MPIHNEAAFIARSLDVALNQNDLHDHVQLAIVERIEERTNDLLIAQDGRQVFWLNPVIMACPLLKPKSRGIPV